MSGISQSIAGFRASKETSERPQTTVSNVAILAGRIVLLLALATGAWFFGGVQARVQVWLLAALVFVAATWLIGQCLRREAIGKLPWAVLPLLCGLVLVALQVVPLEKGLLSWLSPKAGQLRASLAAEENPADAALVDGLGLPEVGRLEPISLYPGSTRRDLALMVSVVAAFAVGAAMFSRGRSFVWLLAALAANGGALAFFGIVQQLTFSGKLFWTVPLTYGGSPFGPFVNRNNAGGFLLLCLAGALALTGWVFRRENESGESVSYADAPLKNAPCRSRWRESASRFFAGLDAWKLASLTLASCVVAGIFCSLSRGSIVAMLGAVLVTTLAVWLARRQEGLPLRLGLVALLAGVGLVSWAGMSEPVRARMATLLDLGVTSKPLTAHWGDSIRAVPDFWQTGSGLGTYRFIYELYQREPNSSWFVYAENMYLETLIETGAAGLAIVLASMALVGIACWRLLRRGADLDAQALGVAGAFALSSQAIAAMFDFGLRVPANALTLAVLFGAVTGRAAVLRWKEQAVHRQAPAGGRRRMLPVVASIAVLAGLIWGCLQTKQVAAVEAAMKQMDRLGPEGYESPGQVRQVLGELERSISRRPDDAQALCCLAHLDIQLYRLKVLDRFSQQVSAQADRVALWRATLPLVLHGRIQQYAGAGDFDSIARIRDEPVVADHLLPALERLVLSRRACPLLPDVHLLIAELGVLASPPGDNQIHLARAALVAPAKPSVAFESGIADFQAGRSEQAIASWRECLALDGKQLPEIARRLRIMGKMRETLGRVLPDSPELLIRAAEDERITGFSPALRAELLDRAAMLLQRSGYPEDERRYLLGAICALRGQEEEAIADYWRAVELSPRNLVWRYELALLLKRERRLAEAHEQARYCAVMEPASEKYQALLEEINRTRIAAGEDSR
jgi:tetratricopeptide (TPR) repeat protein